MKTVKILVIAAIALVLSLTFALAGCEGGGDDGSSSNNGYVGDDSNGSGGEDTNGTLESGLIVATAPNDFVGDFFFFEDEAVCIGVNVCKAEATGVVSVEFTRPDALFLTKYAKADPNKDQEVTWNESGDWGLAPQGMYRDDDGQDHVVKTVVEEAAGQIHVLLWEGGTIIGAIDGNVFAWTTSSGIKTNGNISADLKTIQYHTVGTNGKEADRILIRVE